MSRCGNENYFGCGGMNFFFSVISRVLLFACIVRLYFGINCLFNVYIWMCWYDIKLSKLFHMVWTGNILPWKYFVCFKLFNAIYACLPVCLVNAEQIRQHLIKASSHAQALQVHWGWIIDYVCIINYSN